MAVSRTTRPVTHVADVAVKRALPKDVEPPDLEEMGSISRSVPSAMMPANPRMTILNEESLLLFGIAVARGHAPYRG